jgi:hypothetical protein
VRVGERRDERAQRVWREGLARIGENQDLVVRGGHAGVDGAGLSRRWQQDRFDAPAIGLEHGRRVVGRTVGHDDDLHPIEGIVRFEQVVEAPAKRRRFIARRHHDRNARRDR